jgi:outer membrane immunogenic protein
MRQRTLLERHMIRPVVGRCVTASGLAATLAIRRSLMATVSCLALTGAAAAADIPARVPMKAPSPPVVTQIWAGPYIGVNGGAVWHRMAVDTTDVGVPYDSARTRVTGGTFGGQVGYNWQSQNFVYGLEADANWVGGETSHRQIANNGLGVAVIYTTKLTWLATARARAGVAFGRTLVYGTGGLAVGGVNNSWTFAPGFCCELITNNKTRAGWTAGGGIEHFISNPHITVKAEALYVDLGRTTVAETSGTGYTSRFKNTAIVGRLGLNLKW